MNLNIEIRENLKQDLLNRTTTLGQQALLPTEKSELDGIVQQLEALNPTPLPLTPENRSLLLGDWKLLYASNGTVITRRLPGGIIIHAIWQTLSAAGEAALSATGNSEGIVASNGAELELPLLGRVQLQAQGHWQWQGKTQTATVAFDAFSLQATGLFQQAHWELPALHIPVLEGLRREAAWQTSYLDLDLRIGRGATGNLFVFARSPLPSISSQCHPGNTVI
ncbi:PAP fibrillin [Trichocoleus sp. FACHB-591]|uniref:PAP/fibrillin family protein n=1 Tax=Trichocoleus sp. FACHB-591 TaxID=2692872 RepID=UPI001689627D|nr:PAP/fibrillin family protein [Trichocoleus sp. FACHB-591]MBD2098598.1 PAP fibrillin [Trichocoleus sp. FACHB-591]